MNHNKGCILCGEELYYHQNEVDVTCVFCKKTFKSNVMCSSKHYVCDCCHGKKGIDYVYEYAMATNEVDPIKIFESVIKSPLINLHGPEHHVIVPMALLSAYYNKLGENEAKMGKLKIAYDRGSKVPGGTCGNYGACGAGIGAGLFFSIIQDNTPLSGGPWGQSNAATGEVLMEIGKIGGPRCCKRNGYVSIIRSLEILKRDFGVDLVKSKGKVICFVKNQNIETCLKSKCPFFK